ncbi:Malignant T-cell-amplified sequence 1 [Ceratobasidium sp. AG-Ba]|nr:Malignant T-cell-amplified sequence 1 [Ceratobasidium sp. AG-Ba]QRW00366.1 Malignant T-cell-amplified sequence 1 [Ceratobasidium sp. AG-Ba]QRW14883.1 Malignant T-cell-amplified sequence 1 [Ceratobasidium sp. AG-Ba]
MFKKFSTSTDIASNALIKSSAQRGIRTKLLEQMPALAADNGALLEYIWPKKEGITLVKCREHVVILALHGEPLFFQHDEEPYLPSLKLLHKFPNLLPHVQIDRGAIPYLLGGAHMMVPGFTSKGGKLPEKDEALPAGAAVAIHSEGKEHAVGVGILKHGTEEIKKLTKGTAVEVAAYIGDGLWAVDKL